ncbi:sulfurtransferase [Acuticoccus kandeliae]|uniref:sulfurtransferase n=1 Tax=Acuticoccus kandeliae TaxID=2073160 RepID=UPI000D3E1BA8|nr:rhodanese-like domain-containing protein [Acuticoccus kandeliae]
MHRFLIVAAATILSVATASAAPAWSPLMAPADVAAIADAGDVAIIDIRDKDAFATAHLPGAVNAPYADWRGPAANPGAVLSDEALTTLLQGLGLEHDDRVVVTHAGINQTDFGAAARVYWTLKSAGIGEIAILNGGVRSWIADGLPLSVDPTPVTPSEATFTLSDEWMIDRAGIASVLAGERSAALVDARPEAFFRGETKHAAANAPGTLRGAKSLPHATWFEGAATEIAPSSEAQKIAASAPIGGDGPVVSFCNTGHWAATNWFAMSELAGQKNVKLYPESMVGWVNGGGDAVAGQ